MYYSLHDVHQYILHSLWYWCTYTTVSVVQWGHKTVVLFSTLETVARPKSAVLVLVSVLYSLVLLLKSWSSSWSLSDADLDAMKHSIFLKLHHHCNWLNDHITFESSSDRRWFHFQHCIRCLRNTVFRRRWRRRNTVSLVESLQASASAKSTVHKVTHTPNNISRQHLVWLSGFVLP